MKSYYELERKEKQDFLSEFNKLPGGKEINNKSYIFSVIWFFSMIVSFLIGEISIDFSSKMILELNYYFAFCSVFFFIALAVNLSYKQLAFRQYIRVKHKVN
jgi:hypothetical protein